MLCHMAYGAFQVQRFDDHFSAKMGGIPQDIGFGGAIGASDVILL